MNKYLLSVSTVVLLAVTSPGDAADMTAKPVYKAPVVAPAFTWTGLYIGAHLGAACGRTTTSNTSPFGGFDEGFPISYDINECGAMGGGQLGYNWQVGSWVLGLEGELGYLGIKDSISDDPTGLVGLDNFVEVKFGGYGTIAGRLGYTWNRLMLYGKGGVAFARIRNTAADIIDGTTALDPTDFSEVTKTHVGWAAGGGLEYAFTPNWSIKGEYLYMDFGTVSSSNVLGDTFDHRNRVHTGKVGFNYRFGG